MEGINQTGIAEAFAEDETRKSDLILESQMLQQQNRIDEIARKFAEAAHIEEDLGHRCQPAVGRRKSFVQSFCAFSL